MIHCWLVHIFHSWVGFANHQVLLMATRNPGGTHQLRLVGSFSHDLWRVSYIQTGWCFHQQSSWQAIRPLLHCQPWNIQIVWPAWPSPRTIDPWEWTFKENTCFFSMVKNLVFRWPKSLGFFGLMVYLMLGAGEVMKWAILGDPRIAPASQGWGSDFGGNLLHQQKNTNLWNTRGKRNWDSKKWTETDAAGLGIQIKKSGFCLLVWNSYKIGSWKMIGKSLYSLL